MAIFNFLENFFFISLAITFGLLLLLVYHFKERMSLVEKKSDTMNEIITNVVKEMKSLRLAMIQQQSGSFGIPPHQISPVPVVSSVQSTHVVKPEPQSVVHIPFSPPHIEYSIKEYDHHEAKQPKIVVSDESESESESEYETESESDNESNTEMKDESSDDDSDEESVSDEESDEEPDQLDIQEINDIPIDLDVDVIDTLDNNVPIETIEHIQSNIVAQQMEVLETTNTSANTSDHVELPEVKPEIILTEKQIDEPLPPSTITRVVVDQPESKDPKREVYRKMNINQLRTIAISAGLTQDTSKMKKNDLIKLLEALDDE